MSTHIKNYMKFKSNATHFGLGSQQSFEASLIAGCRTDTLQARQAS